MKKLLSDFSKYSGVATAAAACDWVVFVLLDFVGLNYLFAQMTARISGGLLSFIVNRNWSFDAKRPGHLSQQGRRFVVLYIFSYLLSVGTLYVAVEHIGIPKYYAKFIADGTSLIVNFIAMRTYVFKDRDGFTAMFVRLFQVAWKKSRST